MLSYEELESKVLQTGLCTACGACISSCPLYYIQSIDGKPKRPKKKAACSNCGTCFNSCYKISGEIIGEGIGKYLRIVSAKWNKSAAYQDGGIVTALLRQAFEMKLTDGALVTCGKGWMPLPWVAKSNDDFGAFARTKFGISQVLMNLRPGVVEHMLNKLCVVGTPCHIQSVRHLQEVKAELSSAITLTIGLFCSENIEYRYIAGQMEIAGLKEEDVDKVIIVNGKLNIHAGNKRASIPLSDIKNFVPQHCYFCGDYTSELADISVGSEGSQEGWSTVVLRTEKGEELFSELERSGTINTSSISSIELEHLKETSEKKRKRAKAKTA